MRREGFELTVCPPRVLAVVGDDGISREPIEEGEAKILSNLVIAECRAPFDFIATLCYSLHNAISALIGEYSIVLPIHDAKQCTYLRVHDTVTVDVDPEMQGMVIENMSSRNGNLSELKDIGNRTRMVFVCAR